MGKRTTACRVSNSEAWWEGGGVVSRQMPVTLRRDT